MSPSQSVEVGDLVAALAKAQGTFAVPVMSATARITSERANYQFKYAPLDEGFKAVRAALSENGIALTQRPFEERDEGRRFMMLETRLSYGNQYMSMVYPVADLNALFALNDKGETRFDPKKLGAVITYAKRYSLFSFLCLAGEEDVEGDALDAARQQSGNGKQNKAFVDKPFPPEQSVKVRDELLDDLKKCKSQDECTEWARNSRTLKMRLLQEHRDKLNDAFVEKSGEFVGD